MRAPVKLTRPLPQAVGSVKARMAEMGLFTRNEVHLWFHELDAGLGKINARRAADALLAELTKAHLIVLMSMSRGYVWHGPKSTTEQA